MDSISLRVHHILNLLNHQEDNYESYWKTMKTIYLTQNGVKKRIYSDEAAANMIGFYQQIITNPDSLVIVSTETDDICRRCNNYDGKGCILYTREELLMEDMRTHKEQLPDLVIGRPVSIAELLRTNIMAPEIPDYMFFGAENCQDRT
jgi:hypothetical protein